MTTFKLETHKKDGSVLIEVFHEPDEEDTVEEDEPEEEVVTENKYDPQVWQSVSRKYRMISRLPEGMSGVEALRKHAPPEAYQKIVERIERESASTFRRLYAERVEGCHAELSPDEWAAFRAAGGEASW